MVAAFITSASAEATSVTLPAHQAGDILLMVAARTGTSSLATVPAGWHICYTRAIGSAPARSMILAWKIAASSGETSGTWTNANLLTCAVYRHSTNVIVMGRGNGSNNVATVTVPYVALSQNTTSNNTPNLQGASELVVGVVLTAENTGDGAAAPSGMTNRTTFAGASAGYIAIHDTTTTVTSFPATNVTAAGSVNSVTITAELFDTGVSRASSGGARMVSIRGGADQ